jgi:hypothetical protein
MASKIANVADERPWIGRRLSVGEVTGESKPASIPKIPSNWRVPALIPLAQHWL